MGLAPWAWLFLLGSSYVLVALMDSLVLNLVAAANWSEEARLPDWPFSSRDSQIPLWSLLLLSSVQWFPGWHEQEALCLLHWILRELEQEALLASSCLVLWLPGGHTQEALMAPSCLVLWLPGVHVQEDLMAPSCLL